MTAREALKEYEGYSVLRFLADMLTGFRFCVAVFVVTIGIFYGSDALHAALVAILLGWMTDLIDGPVARRAPGQSSWLGKADHAIDLIVPYAFFLFLVISGLYPVIPAIGLLLLAGTLALMRPNEGSMQMVTAPFFAQPIVLSYLGGSRLMIAYGLFLLTALAFNWSKLKFFIRRAFNEAVALVKRRPMEEE